jgi:hypothetical protein
MENVRSWRIMALAIGRSDERRVAASNMLGLVFEIRSVSRPIFTFSRAETPGMSANESDTVQDE